MVFLALLRVTTFFRYSPFALYWSYRAPAFWISVMTSSEARNPGEDQFDDPVITYFCTAPRTKPLTSSAFWWVKMSLRMHRTAHVFLTVSYFGWTGHAMRTVSRPPP